MGMTAEEALGASRAYTKATIMGQGAIKGDKGDKGAKGDKGDKGDTGVSVSKMVVNGNNHLIVTLTDGTVMDAGTVPSAGNMDYSETSITTIPAITDGMLGHMYTIGADGYYVLDPNMMYYVQTSWNIISKYDSADFSGEPLAVFDCNSSYDGVNIDDIFTMDKYEYVKALVNGYAVYDRYGTKIMDLPAGVDRAHKLGFGSYITKLSSTTPLRKGDTIVCDGVKWVVLNTALDTHSKGSVHSIGYWGAERAYMGCFEYETPGSDAWNGSKSFRLGAYIEGFNSAAKVIDYSVVLETDSGKFIKASMTGSGMDISAYLTNGQNLSVYSSETIVRMIFCIQFVV